MSDLNSRKWIAEALIGLPAKTRNKNLVGNLRRFSEIAEQSRDTLALSIRGAARVKLVFPDAQLASLVDKLLNAQKKARTCVRDVSQTIEAVAKPSFEARLIEIKDHGAGSVRPVLDTWQRRLDDAIRPYEKVARIVEERRLEGSEAFMTVLINIRAARTQTPPTDADALAIKRLIDGLPGVVRSLGLTGRVGTFLVAVAEGTGPARELDVAEIREFLDRYELWDALRVGFGASR
jgi:hypothetical protein